MDYRKLNALTEKDLFHMPFMDQILDKLEGKGKYCFLMFIPAIIKYLSHRKTKRRPLFSLPLWDLCIQTYVIWVVQYSSDLPTLYDVDFL